MLNIVIVFILITIFSYGFAYPYLGEFRLPSNCEELGDCYCKSRGLSRAFSAMVYLEYEDANTYNSNIMSVFLFFAIQLIVRAGILCLRSITRGIALIDFFLNMLFILYVFLPFTPYNCT